MNSGGLASFDKTLSILLLSFLPVETYFVDPLAFICEVNGKVWQWPCDTATSQLDPLPRLWASLSQLPSIERLRATVLRTLAGRFPYFVAAVTVTTTVWCDIQLKASTWSEGRKGLEGRLLQSTGYGGISRLGYKDRNDDRNGSINKKCLVEMVKCFNYC